MTTIPNITTERLVLRQPEPQDFEAYAAFMADARSAMTGGPLDRPAAWGSFARDTQLMTLVEKASGAIAGQVGFWNPEGWLEVELGWRVFEGFEGKGLASEAAVAVRNFAYDTLLWGPLISVIGPENDRSIRLAERLGARLERDDWHTPSGKPALIYRHPSASALAKAGQEAHA